MENCTLQKYASTLTNAEDENQGCKNDAKCVYLTPASFFFISSTVSNKPTQARNFLVKK